MAASPLHSSALFRVELSRLPLQRQSDQIQAYENHTQRQSQRPERSNIGLAEGHREANSQARYAERQEPSSGGFHNSILTFVGGLCSDNGSKVASCASSDPPRHMAAEQAHFTGFYQGGAPAGSAPVPAVYERPSPWSGQINVAYSSCLGHGFGAIRKRVASCLFSFGIPGPKCQPRQPN
jgi:hypothetical protein